MHRKEHKNNVFLCIFLHDRVMCSFVANYLVKYVFGIVIPEKSGMTKTLSYLVDKALIHI
ncbi:MAG: hypothetical protein AAF639_42865, partial [Chloroflexota bacterium]